MADTPSQAEPEDPHPNHTACGRRFSGGSLIRPRAPREVPGPPFSFGEACRGGWAGRGRVWFQGNDQPLALLSGGPKGCLLPGCLDLRCQLVTDVWTVGPRRSWVLQF